VAETIGDAPKLNGLDDPPDDNAGGPAPNIGTVDDGGANVRPLVETTGATDV
jgi:hypothetical protein